MSADTHEGATAVAKRLTQTLNPLMGGSAEVERDLRWRLSLCPDLAYFWLRMEGTLRQRLALEMKVDSQKGNLMDGQLLPDIVITRGDDGTIEAGVQHIVCHSPTGFEVGYGGSGPADLALSLLEDHLQKTNYNGRRERIWRGTCFRAAYALHQDFKWKFIADLDQDARTWTIRRADVEAFLDERRHMLDMYAVRDDTMRMG